MEYIYRLKIHSTGKLDLITQILKIEPSIVYDTDWMYEVTQRDGDDYYDFINRFLDILEGNELALQNIGIKAENITIWLLYAYDQQCNMEFCPERMKRLGNAGITLCVSCWEGKLPAV